MRKLRKLLKLLSHKNEKYPPNPKTLDDIVIEGDCWTKCENEKDRFLIKDIREIDQITKKMLRIIIYGSDTLLKVLCESELITSDGTFDFAADLFYQVYIFMAFFKKRMFPCVYSLLNCKTKVGYIRMLNEIRLSCLAISLNFHPIKVITDFPVESKMHFKNACIKCMLHAF